MNIVRKPASAPASATAEWDPFRALRDLMRWDPFAEMAPIPAPAAAYAPDFDVRETKTDYVFRADLPGVKEKDVEI